MVDHSIIYDHNFFQNFLKQKFADSIFFGEPSSMELGLHLDFPEEKEALLRITNAGARLNGALRSNYVRQV